MVLVLAVACADPVDTFDASVQRFINVACGNAACVDDEVRCREDVAADLAMAKELLDENGRAHCALCLDVKASIIPDVQACQPSAEQNAMVYDVCDLDPSDDYDRDLDPTNDDDEACAGFP